MVSVGLMDVIFGLERLAASGYSDRNIASAQQQRDKSQIKKGKDGVQYRAGWLIVHHQVVEGKQVEYLVGNTDHRKQQ